jgi:hypothetical protein
MIRVKKGTLSDSICYRGKMFIVINSLDLVSVSKPAAPYVVWMLRLIYNLDCGKREGGKSDPSYTFKTRTRK